MNRLTFAQVDFHSQDVSATDERSVGGTSPTIVDDLASTVAWARALWPADPMTALDLLARNADHLRQYAVDLSDDRRIGFIEGLCQIEPGCHLVTGWISGHDRLVASALVRDAAAHAAGLAIETHHRDDLPDDALGFCGLLCTTWVPGSPSDDPHLVLSVPGLEPTHLRFGAGWKRTSGDDAAGILVHAMRTATDPAAMARLAQLAAAMADWDLRPADGWPRLRLEDIAIVPGFGAFAEGWVLAAGQQVRSMDLRLGSQVIRGDRTTLWHKARPDLLGPGDAAGGQVRPGLVTVLRSLARDLSPGDCRVRLHLADGSVHVAMVPADVTKIVAGAAEIECLRRFYPALDTEPFFPDLARALQRQLSGLPPPVPVVLRPCAAAFFVDLPDDATDAFAILDRLHLTMPALGPDQGLCLVSTSGAARPQVLRWVDQLQGRAGGQVSLIHCQDRQGLWLLDPMLDMLGADRFVWLDRGAILSDLGWQAVEAAPPSSDAGPIILRGQGGVGSADMVIGCAWTRTPMRAWLREHGPLVGGGYLDWLAADTGATHQTGCGWRIAAPPDRPLSKRIDALLMGDLP